MANTVRIKRRASGSPGAPTALNNAELAYNEVDDVLYYGKGTGGAGGTATSVIQIAGPGAFSTLSSPAFTGTPTVPTAAVNTNTTQAASTAFVLAQSSSANPSMNGSVAVGTATKFSREDHVHPVDTSRAPLASPTFTGTASAPSAAVDTNTTEIATTAFVIGQAASSTPSALGSATVGTSTRFSRADHVHALPTYSQLAAPTADISWGTYKLTSLGDPVNAQDAATKNYVDSVAQGLTVKGSVKCATTASLTLSGIQTIDGVTVAVGDRVLVKNQTSAAQNGIYIVSAAAWSRSADANAWAELISAFTFIEQGTTNSDTGWVATANAGGTLGTTDIAFAQFSGAGTYVAGNGLTLTGSSFSAAMDGTSLSVSSAGIRINASWVGQNTITTLGTITTGVWNGTTVGVAYGGTGASTLSGLLKGNGTSAFTAAVDGTDYLSPSATIDGGTF